MYFVLMMIRFLFGGWYGQLQPIVLQAAGPLPSASLGEGGPGLYEPVHGSAPDIAGRGIANPIGMILCVAMMCRMSLGWTAAADCVEAAVAHVLDGGARTADIAGPDQAPITTAEMGTCIAEAVAEIDVPTDKKSESPCVPT